MLTGLQNSVVAAVECGVKARHSDQPNTEYAEWTASSAPQNAQHRAKCLFHVAANLRRLKVKKLCQKSTSCMFRLDCSRVVVLPNRVQSSNVCATRSSCFDSISFTICSCFRDDRNDAFIAMPFSAFFVRQSAWHCPKRPRTSEVTSNEKLLAAAAPKVRGIGHYKMWSGQFSLYASS